MSNIICVTNRALCAENFLLRMERIAEAHPRQIILRETDLSLAEYTALTEAVLPICSKYGVPLVLSRHIRLARQLHLPVQLRFAEAVSTDGYLNGDGVSVHCVEEAKIISKKHPSLLIAGHIWETDCKKGLSGRGTQFLRNIAESADGIPVFAIGGITPERMQAVRESGAEGACIMSTLMTCKDPAVLLASLTHPRN